MAHNHDPDDPDDTDDTDGPDDYDDPDDPDDPDNHEDHEDHKQTRPALIQTSDAILLLTFLRHCCLGTTFICIGIAVCFIGIVIILGYALPMDMSDIVTVASFCHCSSGHCESLSWGDEKCAGSGRKQFFFSSHLIFLAVVESRI